MEILASHEDADIAVNIGNLGTFNVESLKLFQSACNSKLEASKVVDKEAWLSQFSSGTTDILMIRNIPMLMI